MVPWVDVALAAFLKSLRPNSPVVFAPEATARKQISVMQEHKDTATAWGGFAFWRTGCAKTAGYASGATATEGFNSGRQLATDPQDKFNIVQKVNVTATYDVNVWTRDISVRNGIERDISFCSYYTTLDALIKGGEDPNNPRFTAPVNWPFTISEPRYSEIPDSNSGKVLWYSLNYTFEVTTAWMKTRKDPYIDEILLKVYNVISTGEPIDEVLLDTISIIRKGSDVP